MTARADVQRLADLGAHMLSLKTGVKPPCQTAWQHAGSMTMDAAEAHLAAGGNLGVIPGRSRLVVIDAEDALATGWVRGLGFRPTVMTAKSGAGPVLADGTPNTKQGGTHTWLTLPADAPADLSDAPTFVLPNGGKIEFFASTGTYVVAPPSRLDEAGGLAYMFTGEPVDEAPAWMWDASVPCPSGAEPRRGCLAPKTPYARVEGDVKSQELTDSVDSVPWEAWLDGDPRLTPTGQVDGCGCEIWHWQGADSPKSATLHDNCSQGNGVHIWSGTMIAQLGLSGGHLSRLQLSAALRGVTVVEAAASVGITLCGGGREPLAPLTPEGFEDSARDAAAAGDGVTAERLRAHAATLRAQRAERHPNEVYTVSPIAGGVPTPPVIPQLHILQGGGESAAEQRPPLSAVPQIGSVGITPPGAVNMTVPSIGTVNATPISGTSALQREPAPGPLAGMRSGAWLNDQCFAPLEYHVPGIVTEGCGIIAGPPKVGKSWLVLSLALAIAGGGTALGCLQVEPRPVLYLALEDGHRRMQARSRQLLGPGVRIPAALEYFLEIPDGMTAAGLITEWLALHPGAKPFVVVDTLGKTRGAGPGPGTNAYQQDYKALGDLKSAIDARPGSGLLIVHHTRKSEAGRGGGRAGDFVEALSGTFGLSGAADYAMVLGRERETEQGALAITGRDVHERTVALTRDRDTGLWTLDGGSIEAAEQAIADRANEPETESLGSVSQAIIAAVVAGCPEPGSTMGPQEIADALHTEQGRIAKYLSRLVDGGYLTRPERGRYAPVAKAPGAVPPAS